MLRRERLKGIRNQKVIVDPNSPSTGVLVAFIELSGALAECLALLAPIDNHQGFPQMPVRMLL